MFSCEHRPGDPDTLATGSYGSSVKVWHVPTMDLKVSLFFYAFFTLVWYVRDRVWRDEHVHGLMHPRRRNDRRVRSLL